MLENVCSEWGCSLIDAVDLVYLSWFRLDICFMSKRGRAGACIFKVVSVFVTSLFFTSEEEDWRPTELLGMPVLGIT